MTDLADEPPPRSREAIERWARPFAARAWRAANEIAGIVLVIGMAAAFVANDPWQVLAEAFAISAVICAVVLWARRIGLVRRLVVHGAAHRARVVAIEAERGMDAIRLEWSEGERGHLVVRDSKLAVGDIVTVLPSPGFRLYAAVAGQLVVGERA